MTTADEHIDLNGARYDASRLPVIYFGRAKPLAYVINAKAACTMALNALFFCNHGYAYFDPHRIHESNFGFIRLGPDFQPDKVKRSTTSSRRPSRS